MKYIYILVFEKQDQSGQTINKRVLSFDNVKSAFEFAESEMDDHWTQSITILRSPRGFLYWRDN